MIKYTAIFIAAILGISLVTAAYAQNATSLQIQLVPKIQRGHQQQLTIFAVDNQGNQVNGSGEIISSIENAQGTLVGPKTVYTESGEHIAYKVGPNTRPQNITINSCLSSGEICAEQSYYVFPKGQGQTEPPIILPAPVPTPEVPPVFNETTPAEPADNQTEGEIIVPSNETEVTLPENGTDVTINDTGEAEPLPPLVNQTQNQTGEPTPIPLPPQNETEVPPVINESIPIEANITIPENATTEPAPLPPLVNESQPDLDTEVCPPICGNETLPVEGNITVPVTNATQNATVEPEPEPGSGPIIDEGGAGGTPNGTETIPVEGNVTVPANSNTTENATIDIEREQPLNATEAFNQLENATAIQDEKIDEVRDNGNDVNRGELKTLVADTSEAIGQTAPVIANATNDQLSILQNSFTSGSEAIDEIVNPNEPEGEGDNEGEGQ